MTPPTSPPPPCLQRGPPFSSSLGRLEASLSAQMLSVMQMVQGQALTPLQRSVLENVIISKVRWRLRGLGVCGLACRAAWPGCVWERMKGAQWTLRQELPHYDRTCSVCAVIPQPNTRTWPHPGNAYVGVPPGHTAAPEGEARGGCGGHRVAAGDAVLRGEGGGGESSGARLLFSLLAHCFLFASCIQIVEKSMMEREGVASQPRLESRGRWCWAHALALSSVQLDTCCSERARLQLFL